MMGDAKQKNYIRWFESLDAGDVSRVGGKNASLGEMIQALKHRGIRVPDGFATTAEAYREYLEANDLSDKIESRLDDLNAGKKSLEETGGSIRRLIGGGTFPEPIANSLRDAYADLCERSGAEGVDVAVRSSATAEDLPEASFAGQQE